MEPTNRRETRLGEKQRRAFSLDRAQINEAERTAVLSFASEEPVERYYRGEIIQEVIDMKTFDVSRLNGSGALLLNHDSDQQVGGITKAWVDADGVARASVKFSKSQRGEEIFQDVKDGIRGSTSVGYELLEETGREERDGVVTIRFRAAALEASLVGVPADVTVGVGRSEETIETQKKIYRVLFGRIGLGSIFPVEFNFDPQFPPCRIERVICFFRRADRDIFSRVGSRTALPVPKPAFRQFSHIGLKETDN